MYSMADTPAAIGSLLLNFESVATGLVAAFIFREAVRETNLDRKWHVSPSHVLFCHMIQGYVRAVCRAVGVLLACLFWAFDNNISKSVSGKDPFHCAS
jgi:ABC-type transporter Mla maintaining outer membrane lipid asymmetry permease subunit MlaE